MKKIVYYSTALILSCSMFACVPQRKLEEEQTKREGCEKELSTLKVTALDCDTKLTEANVKLADNEKAIVQLKKDTTQFGKDYRNITSKYDKLNLVNEQILEKYNRLMEGNVADTKKISGQLQVTQEQLLQKQDELKQRQDELKQLEVQLNTQKKNLDDLTAELKKREERVAELEGILKSKDAATNELKKKVSDALLGFEGKGLTITQKNGKVYVSMDESLLFASGSTVVEAKGIDALKKVAKVLEQNTDINVMIEGHTDDVPMVGKGEIKDNWDLSVMRATSIVKIIIKNSATDPKRLTACGRGEYFPLDAAKTADARKKNRRTEIILTPKLDELLKVLESN
jgi:chemotaxis protein MotB